MLLAIDPGNEESGFALVAEEDLKPLDKGKINNEQLLQKIKTKSFQNFNSEGINHIAIEMVASYGMPVGVSVFETCVWIGRFVQAIKDSDFNIDINNIKYIYRKEEKINLCNSLKAKDCNIVQALVDRFAPNTRNKGKGTKKEPGWFYGFKKDIWQAYAVAVTYWDKMHTK